MKKFGWLEWTLIGLAVALLIAGIVCFFCAPKVTFLIAGILLGGLVGLVAGYYVARKNIL